MPEIKLKPCPFCGGEAGFRYWTMDGDWYVRCFTCKADIYEYDTKAEAAEAWNRRAEPERPVVHAHWESAEFDDELKTCSNCHCDKDNNGTTWYYIRPEWRYCPLCGAIMDEVSE